MALTRSALREKGITEKEILDYIMEEHGNTVEAAKEKAKETADKAAEKLQSTIDSLQEKIDNAPKPETDGEDWKAKYEAEVTAHKVTVDGYRTEKTTTAQNKALHEALKAAGANEKFISLVIDKVDRSKAVFEGDIDKGFTVKNSDDIVKPVKEQYGDIFGTVTVQGAGVATPPKAESAKPTGHKDMNAFIRGVAE